MDEVPQGVGRTALATAWIRAEASCRPDRLFDDWLARSFVDAAGDAVPIHGALRADGTDGADATSEADGADDLVETMSSYLVVRTRFFDDELTAAAAAGCRQVVILAAGLDSRAFRLPWPSGTRLFELDQPAMMSFKERVLAGTGVRPRCERHVVPADLTEDWADRLLQAGFRPAEPTAWLAEGILVYLAEDQAERLLAEITDLSAPSSRFALEDARNLAGGMLDQIRRNSPMGQFADLWKGGLEGESPAWLGAHGWRGRETPFARIAANLNRSISAALPVEGYFVTARRAGSWEETGVTRATAPTAAGAGAGVSAGVGVGTGRGSGPVQGSNGHGGDIS
ncbi:SAM-dependent methyltransferase [Parafrankia sp. FMc2]|uniref:SAM-dependent methyltransferase n=1 Tax=Parafrankia sp. FMc2 TaxID=3233196 RepID=UPI0034D6D78E